MKARAKLLGALGILAIAIALGTSALHAEDMKPEEMMKKADEVMKKCDDMMAMCDKMAGMKGDMPMSCAGMMCCHECDECCRLARGILAGCVDHVEKDPKMAKEHIQKAIALLDKCLATHKKVGEMMMGMHVCSHCKLMGTLDKCPGCKGDMKAMKDMMCCPGCGMMSDKMTKCDHCKMDMKKADDMMKTGTGGAGK
ncbi:hypothetical protein HY251_19355 [bacterium]|nr:hypothetical protein [bacterium]